MAEGADLGRLRGGQRERGMTLRETLLSMGYREEKDGKWLKPIGYQLFQVTEATWEWTNWFKNIEGTVSRWESKTLNPNASTELLLQLMEFETWTRTDLYVTGQARFQLRAVDL